MEVIFACYNEEKKLLQTSCVLWRLTLTALAPSV